MLFNGREITNIKLRKVNHNDYPRYVDAFVAHAKYVDGKWLTDAETEELTTQMHADGTMTEMCNELLMWE